MLAALKRPEVNLTLMAKACDDIAAFPRDVREYLEITVKFDGYIQRDAQKIQSFVQLEEKRIPEAIDYAVVPGLSTELVTKLKRYQPRNLSEASRIPEITPAALNTLWIYIRGHKFS